MTQVGSWAAGWLPALLGGQLSRRCHEVAFPWRSRSPTIKVLRYRGDRPPCLDGRIVVLADDGLATGYTARAAIEHIRGRGAIPPISWDRT